MRKPEKLKPRFWAILNVYTPFCLGASWTFYRYEVEAEPLQLKGFWGFIYKRKGKFRVHEMATGGLLAKDESEVRAVAKANSNIKRTPDFIEQMMAMGQASRHPMLDPKQLDTLLDKADEEEKKGRE